MEGFSAGTPGLILDLESSRDPSLVFGSTIGCVILCARSSVLTRGRARQHISSAPQHKGRPLPYSNACVAETGRCGRWVSVRRGAAVANRGRSATALDSAVPLPVLGLCTPRDNAVHAHARAGTQTDSHSCEYGLSEIMHERVLFLHKSALLCQTSPNCVNGVL